VTGRIAFLFREPGWNAPHLNTPGGCTGRLASLIKEQTDSWMWNLWHVQPVYPISGTRTALQPFLSKKHDTTNWGAHLNPRLSKQYICTDEGGSFK